MLDYRIYTLDAQGHIFGVVEEFCRDDEHAIETARQRNKGQPLEVWQRGRFVKRLPGASFAPPLAT